MNDLASPVPLLSIRSIKKCFGDQVVLSDANLVVHRGQVVTVLGRSGTGKSVLLKCLAGIETPDGGSIWFDGKELTDRDAQARAEFRRRCSYLFQSNALLDSLTALENVALPLEQTTALSELEVMKRSLEALRQLELDNFADRHPSQMSGGMQKRLALARAIVTRPELVLFDEPTAGLDPQRRNAVFSMIVKYQRQFGFTAVIVTHDVAEVLVISDHVALLDAGTMRFEGKPEAFAKSDDPVVIDFRDSPAALRQQIEGLRQEPHFSEPVVTS